MPFVVRLILGSFGGTSCFTVRNKISILVVELNLLCSVFADSRKLFWSSINYNMF